MAKGNNAPAQAGATPEELEVKAEVVETSKEEVVETSAEAEVVETSKEEVVETSAEAEVVETSKEEVVETSAEVEVIPSNIFVAQDGTEVEFAVQHFIHNRKRYTVEEAVKEAQEVLQELYERNSFIFKKV